MNNSLLLRRTRAAFTLIELLVVITIIAVLAGLLLPVVNKVTNNARKTQAKSTMLSIVTAVKTFQVEYGVYPLIGQAAGAPTADESYGGPNATATPAQLCDVLRHDGKADDVNLNPRGIVFLEMPVAKNATNPTAGIGPNDGQPYDPWGMPYVITIDGNYDNQITNPYTTNAGPAQIPAGVVVISYGADKQTAAGDKNAGLAADDVVSWQ